MKTPSKFLSISYKDTARRFYVSSKAAQAAFDDDVSFLRIGFDLNRNVMVLKGESEYAPNFIRIHKKENAGNVSFCSIDLLEKVCSIAEQPKGSIKRYEVDCGDGFIVAYLDEPLTGEE